MSLIRDYILYMPHILHKPMSSHDIYKLYPNRHNLSENTAVTTSTLCILWLQKSMPKRICFAGPNGKKSTICCPVFLVDLTAILSLAAEKRPGRKRKQLLMPN